MAAITINSGTFHTTGNLPKTGIAAFNFILAGTDLSDVRLSNFPGSKVVLNIFPGIETPQCAKSVLTLNEMADRLHNTRILCISKDLPFTLERFAAEKGINNVLLLSDLRNNDFGQAYGIRIQDGPFSGLLAKALIVLDETHHVIHSQLVRNMEDEPDYQAAIQAIENASVYSPSGTTGYPPTETGIDEICEKMPTGEHARLTDIDDVCDDGRAGKI